MNTNTNQPMHDETLNQSPGHATSAHPQQNQALATVVLACTAILLAALIIVRTGALNAGNAAHAEMATSGSEYTLITTQGGNEELLYVLEARTGNLLVYEPSVSGMRLLNLISVGEFTQPQTQAPGTGN